MFFFAFNAKKESLNAMTRENIEYVVIAFQGIFVKMLEVNNYKIILNSQAKGIKIYVMIKYYILFTKKTILKTTNIKKNCIIRTKFNVSKLIKIMLVLLYIFVCC